MGIIKSGILGGFRNKTGDVVGSKWRTLDIIKGLPRINGKPASKKQALHRSKFKLVTEFCSWMSELVDVGYKNLSNTDTPMNVAVAYHLKDAVINDDENFRLDYSKIAFSQGRLLLPRAMSAIVTNPSEILISWSNYGSEGKYQDDTDIISVMVYNQALHEFVTVKSRVVRSAETLVLSLPAEFSGEVVHVYAAFNSTITTNLVSMTEYLGEVAVV
ncbi:MAG: DUF6266 family protein [Bacteroidota bacterium]